MSSRNNYPSKSDLQISVVHLLQRKYRDQPEATSLTTAVAPTTLMNGVAMSESCALTSHLKAGGLTKTPSGELGAQTGPTDPQRAPSHTLRRHLSLTHL